MRDKEAQLIWETLQHKDVVKERTECDHCNGKGYHVEDKYPFAKKKCEWCDGDGYLNDDNNGTNDDANGDSLDHHNQYMMDQDLLQPIHKAAYVATKGQAKNFNEWLILQIKDQGDNWVNWFIETVIVEERFRD